MMNLMVIEELGKGELEELLSSMSDRFGDSDVIDSVSIGIVVRENYDIDYQGLTILRKYHDSNTAVAFTQISKNPDTYMAYRYNEMQNNEMKTA